MKRIITAIGNENLNQKLKKEEKFEIIGSDIQYKEGILEFLERDNNIDFLILSELLQGQIDIKELIEKIKLINSAIEIILFLEKENKDLENYLYAKGIKFIFYHNKVNFNEIIELIKNEKQETNRQLKKEVQYLKQLLYEKETEKNNVWNIFRKNKNAKNNLVNSNKDAEDKLKIAYQNETNNKYYIKENNKSIEEENNNTKEKNNIELKNEDKKLNIEEFDDSKFIINKSKIINNSKEIICVSGTSGVGKSIFSVNLAKTFMDNKKKILIIDFDILNNSLHTILGIKKYSEKIRAKIKNNNLLKELNIEDLIIKVNSKIDLVSGINLLFDEQYKISSTKIKNIINTLKEKYEVIIIDTSSECFFDYTKEIMKNSTCNIFITEANIAELKKTKKLLNIYINEWKIPQNNFNILFNKYDENSIDISILKNIFEGFQILGKLSNNSQYNLLINKNDTKSLSNNLQKEYAKIKKKLLN